MDDAKSTTHWQDIASWASFSFGNAKAFSDFVGFHVRALFCLTLAFIAIYPSTDVFIRSLADSTPYETPYSSLEGNVQVSAFAIFVAFFLLLFFNILRSIWYCFVSRPNSSDKRLFRLFAWFVGLPLFLATTVLELAAFLALTYRVFWTVILALIATDAERAEINEKLCLLRPFAEATGIPLVPEPICPPSTLQENGGDQ
ncbi:hypothetical protein [Tateyamaria omphalii]|uniref:hypothetical protein n=1 Tax=Tateyamaria omphalii TaxID=299262 RepID=UPI00167AF138|nr:hypothetical protein [Tateyamaria omphalii]